MSNISDWRPTGVEESEHYSDDQIIKIIVAVGEQSCCIPREDFRSDLNNLAGLYFTQTLWEEKPSPSKQRNEYKRINNAASNLLKILAIDQNCDTLECMPYILKKGLISQANLSAEKIGGYQEFQPFKFSINKDTYPDYRGDEALKSAIEGIRRIAQWAENAKTIQQQVVDNTAQEPAHKGNKALNDLIVGLAGIYQKAFNRTPGVSRPGTGGEHGGPWLRFLRTCLAPLNENHTELALRERWRKICPKKQEVNNDNEPDVFAGIDE